MSRFIPSILTASALIATTSLHAEPTVAVYDLDSPISESGQTSTSLFNLSDASRPLTHFDITESLEAAINDNEIKGVVFDVDDSSMSLAQVQEIRSLLLKLREQEKDVWLYTEYLTPTTALLGSAANHMTLMPEGNVMLTGLYGESMYFKNLLDKVGVKVEVIHIGDFKSAGETFYRTGPSEYAEKQQAALLDSLYEQIINQLAEGRKLSKEKVKDIINKGVISPKEALELKLVDHLEYRTDFIKKVRAHYGKETKFDRTYSLPDPNGPEIKGFFDLVKLMLNSDGDAKATSPYIAVVALEGNITDESVAPVRKEILAATRNDNCKGLVLRVNSPGGSALASDVLWEATDEFKATGRPFVVSMGAVAASGGYYVSAGADKIFAEPGTITGSIGVVGMKFVFGDAMDKLGITVHSSKRGKHADLMNITRAYTPEETELIRKSMLDVYGTFKKRIMDGRGDRIKGELEKLAGGRVYSGKDALSIGLVDELGGLNDAINHLYDSLDSENEIDVLLFPEPKSPMEGLFAKPKEDKHEFIQAAHPQHSMVEQLRKELLQSQAVGLLGPDKAKQIESFLNKLEAYQSQRVLLIAPSLPMN
ncbi:hypothetical protein Rhal01_00966 [Rubritalea halochordaticola]|uniref:Peptidase S49 domain-containing protein n=1 Tax=Rubritalea halochordaticola TaxID=714537 RepID=A0ABP9UWP7_9BACT